MASSSGYKLYPPIIGDSIPAFYEEDGAAEIAVPFSMNRAVDPNSVGGLVIKIKTVQSNVLIATFVTHSKAEAQSMIGQNVARFTWARTDSENDFSKISIGQYFKVQIAFMDTFANTGFFSNVGIIKFTAKPIVSIVNAESTVANAVELYKRSYIGMYQPIDDPSERPYSYCFRLYNSNREEVESSGWQLHNTSVNYLVRESISLDATFDKHTFNTALALNEQYYIQYIVRTINNLEIESPIYSCIDIPVETTSLSIRLVCENDYDNGYIYMRFGADRHRYELTNVTAAKFKKYTPYKQILSLGDGSDYIENYSISDIVSLSESASFNLEQISLNINPANWSVFNNGIFSDGISDVYNFITSFKFVKTASMTSEDWNYFNIYNIYKQELIDYLEEYIDYTDSEIRALPRLVNPVSFIIERADYYGDFSNWSTIKKLYFTNNTDLFNWSLKDFTIEQGMHYKYAFRQYNEQGIMTGRTICNDGHFIMGDFEDMFLGDSEKQIRIRYNPKVTSFKTTQLEQKIETLGSKFPFVFKNGIVSYKEFPIAGLISYVVDNEELFVKYKDDLNIDSEIDLIREGTPNEKILTDELQTLTNSQFKSYNIHAERRFKLLLLDWLNNGKTKIFRTATEGNYLVRLMNVSLTPDDSLSRMLHTLQAQACEVAEYSIPNLIDYGFIDTSEADQNAVQTKHIAVYNDIISQTSNSTSINTSIKINGTDKIVNYLKIEPSENSSNGIGFYLRIGGNSVEKRTFILPDQILNLSLANSILPDIYFNALDNIEIINTLISQTDSSAVFSSSATYNTSVVIDPDAVPAVTIKLKAAIQQLLSDLVVNYSYYSSTALVGSLGNITNIYVKNTAETQSGPYSQNFTIAGPVQLEGTGSKEDIIKFLVLNFFEKPIIDLTYQANAAGTNNYYLSTFTTLASSKWDELAIYRISYPENMFRATAPFNANKHYFTQTSTVIDGTTLYHYELVASPKESALSTYYESSNERYYSGKTKSTISSINTSISLQLEGHEETVTAMKPPVAINQNAMYTHISIGNGVYMQLAYQSRVVTYRGA